MYVVPQERILGKPFSHLFANGYASSHKSTVRFLRWDPGPPLKQKAQRVKCQPLFWAPFQGSVECRNMGRPPAQGFLSAMAMWGEHPPSLKGKTSLHFSLNWSKSSCTADTGRPLSITLGMAPGHPHELFGLFSWCRVFFPIYPGGGGGGVVVVGCGDLTDSVARMALRSDWRLYHPDRLQSTGGMLSQAGPLRR